MESSALVPISDLDSSKFTVISRSPMLKPAQMPLGKAVVGVFTKLITCHPQKDKLGNMAEIVPVGSKVGVCIPLTGVLKGALRVTGEGDDAESEFVGKEVAIQRLNDKIPSKKGQDAWNFIVAVRE